MSVNWTPAGKDILVEVRDSGVFELEAAVADVEAAVKALQTARDRLVEACHQLGKEGR